MSSFANVLIHASQFPANVRKDLLASLHRRQVNHKFHYDSLKQAQKWLALHRACSPSRTDPECAAIYERGFETAARQLKANPVHVIGLGCGGGQKDTRLLTSLKSAGAELFYTPCDVSVALVLVAWDAALAAVKARNCFPLVLDLDTADDLSEVFQQQSPAKAARLVTFFGMIPNFEPQIVLPKLATLLRPGDFLLFSANLAPGNDYSGGMQSILPQYDNSLTRDWLLTFLLDLGVERHDGTLRFGIEDDPAGSGLKRVTADFHFLRPREIRIDSECFVFQPDDSIRLFYSYRHTPALIGSLLGGHGLHVQDQWVAGSGEEGVFWCRRGS